MKVGVPDQLPEVYFFLKSHKIRLLSLFITIKQRNINIGHLPRDVLPMTSASKKHIWPIANQLYA
jgi:hypothetical protein